MSRLIDADARVTVNNFDPMNEEYSHEEMTVEQALDFATDEGCPPIINAIPVEWLEEQRQDMEDAEQDFPEQAIRYVLWLWKAARGE